MPSPKPSKKPGVQAIERACSILDLLGKGKQTYSIRELAHELNLPKPTVHRMLTTFCRFGYVIQDEVSKEYRLGFRLVELGQAVLDRIDVRKEAEPYLHRLAARVQETVHLAILDENEIVYLEKVERMDDPKGLRMASRVGMRIFAHCCAVGKVLLAFMPDRSKTEIFSKKGLPRLTENTIVDAEQLQEHLTMVEQQGYAVDDEENEVGIRCVAAPVRNDRGKVIAGISISGPAVRVSLERIHQELKWEVMKTAAELSSRLGFRTVSEGR
ncbi:MAG: IclR family transcriptional regulator [Syntrophobacteria bacterium]|jgi:DNA-binding IclR family transcriptional regulator